MIDQRDMMAVLERLRGDAVVVGTMTGGRAWNRMSKLPNRDLPIQGCMGKASSVALGLALARPDLKVFVIDGDGSLLNNLGSLVTIAGKAPQNLCHFVLENGVYATTGGQPIPAQNKVSFANLAKAAGYAAAYEYDDLEDFATSAERVLKEKGPVLVCIKTVPEIENEPIGRRNRSGLRTTKEAMIELSQSLASG